MSEIDLDAIAARRQRWLDAADTDLPIPQRILYIGASANDVPELVLEIGRLRAQFAEAAGRLTDAMVQEHFWCGGPVNDCPRPACTAARKLVAAFQAGGAA